MHETPFAGLLALQPGDAIESDGGEFMGRNIDTLDHFAEVGAVTHKHDAHAALSTPSAAASAVAGLGGSLAPGVSMAFGYTLIDAYGGETALSPTASAITAGSTFDPATAPAAAFASGAGSLPVGNYYYAVTLVDADGGETLQSPYASVTRPPGYASGEILVSGLTAIRGAAASWRLYRSVNGGGWALLDVGTSDTYLDNGSVAADASVTPPRTNTTGGTAKFTVTVPAQASGSLLRLYGTRSGEFTTPCLIDEIARPVVPTAFDVTTLALSEGAPPPINLSKPGANPVDALTDVINLASAMMALGSAALALGSAWGAAGSGYLSPRYSKTRPGYVLVEGVVGKQVGTPVAGEVIGTLPAGARPSATVAAEVTVITPRGRASVDIGSAGTITLKETPGGSALSLQVPFLTP